MLSPSMFGEFLSFVFVVFFLGFVALARVVLWMQFELVDSPINFRCRYVWCTVMLLRVIVVS